MTLTESLRTVLSRRTTVDGRACRSEYGWWMLAAVLGNIALALLDRAILGPLDASGPLSAFFLPLTLLATIAVSVRRLHDTGRDGRWLLMALVPLVGWALVLVWTCSPGTTGPNRFGHDPIQA